jgi:hypothetical protein
MKPLQRDSWQEAWELAVDLTVDALRSSDLTERCRNSGAVLDDQGTSLEITFLGEAYQVSLPDFEVTLDGRDVHITDRILLLHYLQLATGRSAAGEWTGFEQVPGGELYLRNFRARSVDRLLRSFGESDEKLPAAAESLGGRKLDLADISYELLAMPRVPVALTFWRGDDEFPASANLLFKASATEYLSTEDMVVLAGVIAGRLIKAADQA